MNKCLSFAVSQYLHLACLGVITFKKIRRYDLALDFLEMHFLQYMCFREYTCLYKKKIEFALNHLQIPSAFRLAGLLLQGTGYSSGHLCKQNLIKRTPCGNRHNRLSQDLFW